MVARESFKTIIDLKNKKSIPIKKKQITISIHYRNDDWRINKNILRGKEYDEYIKIPLLKIKKNILIVILLFMDSKKR